MAEYKITIKAVEEAKVAEVAKLLRTVTNLGTLEASDRIRKIAEGNVLTIIAAEESCNKIAKALEEAGATVEVEKPTAEAPQVTPEAEQKPAEEKTVAPAVEEEKPVAPAAEPEIVQQALARLERIGAKSGAVAAVEYIKEHSTDFVGPAGRHGKDGLPGRNGTDGKDGKQGVQGVTGPKGDWRPAVLIAAICGGIAIVVAIVASLMFRPSPIGTQEALDAIKSAQVQAVNDVTKAREDAISRIKQVQPKVEPKVEEPKPEPEKPKVEPKVTPPAPSTFDEINKLLEG